MLNLNQSRWSRGWILLIILGLNHVSKRGADLLYSHGFQAIGGVRGRSWVFGLKFKELGYRYWLATWKEEFKIFKPDQRKAWVRTQETVGMYVRAPGCAVVLFERWGYCWRSWCTTWKHRELERKTLGVLASVQSGSQPPGVFVEDVKSGRETFQGAKGRPSLPQSKTALFQSLSLALMEGLEEVTYCGCLLMDSWAVQLSSLKCVFNRVALSKHLFLICFPSFS